MPSELLHLPPAYTLVGIYRLVTDPFIRQPVLDKIKHASIRGIVVGVVYAAGSWKILDWFVRTFLVGGGGWFGRKQVEAAISKSDRGHVWVGLGQFGVSLDLVLYTHLLILLPQLSSILRFFIYKNLRLARSRAFALTVSSRGKPKEFWNQGYIEEWAQPPRPARGEILGVGSRKSREARWISWILWWPTQLFLRHYLLLPLSPSLPLLAPLLTSTLRAITTAEYLHQPYFETKGMNQEEVWRWVEERRWAYMAFGFAASLLESIPIVGLFLSISNRIGAAMWAHDLEKRQHLFSHGILSPLPPDQTGFYGMGAVTDLGVDIQQAEDQIEQKWSKKRDL
ncbi:hypothetical protein BCR39DRAFT_575803 [Naematelia encephala]|uniref:Etoposide-induced protein 2.4-domain-containing protein n=1 Tax=Naematelia encephala TaxID=71784 RepID=A0A1Y2BHK0_9TREE|nr:hypothetical protein BCR39DRAFT_575803 [Naematelia encephala]